MHSSEINLINRIQQLEQRLHLLEQQLEQLLPPPLPSERGWTHLEPWQILLRCNKQ